jgi:hypothetical protein
MAMIEIAGFPYFEFQVDKNGIPVDSAARQQAVDALAKGGATDLFVMSHGWNNDMADARDLYKNFFMVLRQLLDNGIPQGLHRKFAVIAILWPSKKFTDEQLIPGGAASTASSITTDMLRTKIDGLKGAFDNPDADTILEQAKQLLPRLADSPSAQAQFADLVRDLPGTTVGNTEDASDRFFKLNGVEVMNRLAKPVMPSPTKVASGGAAHLGTAPGGAAGLGSFFSGISSAALNLLNYTTYYQMKERAGLAGRTAVNGLLREIIARSPGIKLHLVGHSFGARLVTSAALGADGEPPLKFASMTLLQAAFSHNGFALKFDGKSDGFFRRVVSEGRIAGPILITYTVNDKAVGIAYPLASLIAGQNAAALGDANDPFGGLGRNGAQHTPEANALTLAVVGSANVFAAGKIHNLNADKVISSHSDICKPEVAYALLNAVADT